MKKTLLTILCTIIACSCVMGGTFAYLMTKTGTVKNTFTIGSITISLEEKTTEGTGDKWTRTFRMSPGATIIKDPTVTVNKDSEECWLFVKIDESTNFRNFMTYTVDVSEGEWTALADVTGVYYRKVTSSELSSDNASFAIIKDNKVYVLESVTNEMAQGLTEATFPTLSFTAYAVQAEGFDTAALAWNAVKDA